MTTPDPPILPTVGGVIGAGKDRLTAVRPSAADHVDAGEWSILVTGLRGQYGVAARALADEVTGASLGTATGAQLAALAASNFDTPALSGPTASVGEVTFERTVIHAGPGPTFDTSLLVDATGQGLLVNLVDSLNLDLYTTGGHVLSVFDAPSGDGAHLVADTHVNPFAFVPFGFNFGSYVDKVNALKQAINRHLSNQRASDGIALLAHPSADTVNLITADDVTSTNPGGAYGTQTDAETAALFALANACRDAFVAHIAEESRPGVILSGLLVDMAAVPAASPPVAAAQYRVTRGVYMRSSATTVDVPVEATRSGAAANIPAWSTAAPTLSLTARGSLFDATLAPVAIRAAGGGPGQPDATLADAARAGWTGTYGPTLSALRAGALRSAGAVKVALREDPAGRTWVYPIDASWAQSARWTGAIEQVLKGTGADDEWLGLGCRESVGAVVNRLVRIELTVQLRSADYISDTDVITARIVRLVRSYFDDRPDFWSWRAGALRGLVSGADRRRVLSCSAATVRDYAGLTIAEPVEPSAGEALTHWWLADGAVIVDYIAPA